MKRLSGAAMAPFLISPHTSLMTLLQRLNGNPYLFQLVVDASDRLLGCVTDGDVRRALLAKPVVEIATAAQCMNSAPTFGAAAHPERHAELFRKTNSIFPFLPIVDGEGRLVQLLIGEKVPATASLSALVMVGGLGRRLGDRTRNTPKPLLEVRGRPILSHIVERLERAGAETIFLAAHYLADQFVAFAAAHAGPARIEVLIEEEPLGTAGALQLLPPEPQIPFLMLNGDVLTQVDFAALHLAHLSGEHDATIAAAPYVVRVPYGVVLHDAQGAVLGINEKPLIRQHVAAGIYCVNPSLRSLILPGEKIDMPDLLNRAHQAGLRMGIFPLHEYWADIGQPDDLAAAEASDPAVPLTGVRS